MVFLNYTKLIWHNIARVSLPKPLEKLKKVLKNLEDQAGLVKN